MPCGQQSRADKRLKSPNPCFGDGFYECAGRHIGQIFELFGKVLQSIVTEKFRCFGNGILFFGEQLFCPFDLDSDKRLHDAFARAGLVNFFEIGYGIAEFFGDVLQGHAFAHAIVQYFLYLSDGRIFRRLLVFRKIGVFRGFRERKKYAF